jgi:hypothetical protein
VIVMAQRNSRQAAVRDLLAQYPDRTWTGSQVADELGLTSRQAITALHNLSSERRVLFAGRAGTYRHAPDAPPLVDPTETQGRMGTCLPTDERLTDSTLRRIPAGPLSPQEHAQGARLARRFDDPVRPTTRRQCVGGARPCPWVSCQYHLYLEVDRTGTLVLNHPGATLEDLPDTCALDVADRGEATLQEAGEALGVTRERVRQIETVAMKRVVASLQGLVHADELSLVGEFRREVA